MTRVTRASRWWACIVTAMLAATVLVMNPAPARADGKSIQFKRIERCFMRKINAKRVANGRRALAWDRQIGFVARRHAAQIAAERVVRHDFDYTREITGWRRLGQNTGRGNGCDGLFRTFWRSSTHRNNILGRWRYVGVGVVRSGGRIYVQQVFESRSNPGNVYGS